MIRDSVSTTVRRPAADVFAAIVDVTRMGEWSPECTGCRWVAPATGPSVGARFEGDNRAALGPVTLKRWTTTSEVTEYVPDKVFEFVTEGYTTWRYELVESEGVTTLSESFSYGSEGGLKGFVYTVLARRPAALTKGAQRTLARIKSALEA